MYDEMIGCVEDYLAIEGEYQTRDWAGEDSAAMVMAARLWNFGQGKHHEPLPIRGRDTEIDNWVAREYEDAAWGDERIDTDLMLAYI